MDDERFDVRHIGQQGEDRQMVDEVLGSLRVSLNLEGEDRSASVRQVFLLQFMAGLALQRRMMDRFHLGMF